MTVPWGRAGQVLATAVVGTLVGLVVGALPGGAAFSAPTSRAGSVTLASLTPPTSVTATDIGCTSAVAGNTRVRVDWVLSTNTRVTGYRVDRTVGVTTTTVATTGSSTTTITELARPLNTAHTYRVYALVQQWSAASSAAAVTTRVVCT